MKALDAAEARILLVCRELAEGQWELLTRGDATRLEAAEPAWSALYGDPGLQAQVLDWYGAGLPQPHHRRVDLLCREMLRESIRCRPEVLSLEAQLMETLSTRRAIFEGQATDDSELTTVLQTERDPGRREAAWRARAAVPEGTVEALLALRDTRNALAVESGFANFWELGLFCAQEDDQHIGALLDELETALGPQSPRDPWDMEQPLGPAAPIDDVPRRVLATFSTLGLPLDHVQLDVSARAEKSEHAWCIPVDPPNDIRVSACVSPDVDGADTLLHELGHAAHAAYVTGPHLLLRDAPSPAFHEGVAQLFASFSRQPAWLAAAGVTDVIAAADRAARKVEKAMRWAVAWTRFERAFYLEPHTDPTTLYWHANAAILGQRPAVDCTPWARIIHFVSHPVYQQAYMLADLIGAQLQEALGPLESAGERVRRDLLMPGAAETSDEMLKRVTGAPLSAEAWLEAR